ncbi:MAG: phage holin family protein [bacterium]|nr:phage holin family protein [bacterium]
MNLFIQWLVSAVAILIAAYILPGVGLSGFWAALVLAVVLGVLNLLIKPLLILLTLPINILTLGLFTLVINALIIMLASGITPGFQVGGFLNAFLFSLLLALINFVFDRVADGSK